jgi:hypothetical protein
MGLGDFLSGVKDAAVNVGKGALWVADPRHLDDIAEGAGKAVEFVAENPGKTWDTAFEVGRAVVKDQLDPVNLAINAGLLAATVATGGAAAPAFIAKLGMGAKSLEAGVAAAKGIDTAVDVAKGVSTGVKAVEAGSQALKAADTARDVAGAVKTGAKALDVAEDAAGAARTGSKVMRGVDKALGLEPGKFGTKASNILNPLENSRFGMAAARERGAQRMLEAGGEAPGLARQVGAAMLQGGGRGAGGPAQLAGMSDKVYGAQKMLARGEAIGRRAHQAGQFNEGVKVAADPMAAVEDQATKAINERTHAAGYSDRGATAESLYGDTSQTATPGASSSTSSPGSRDQVTENLYDQPEATSQAASTAHRGMHFWEGPRSQWAGGIKSTHNWRTVDPLRPISSPTTASAGEYRDYVKQRNAPGQPAEAAAGAGESGQVAGTVPTAPGTAVDRYMGDLNAQGAPKNFSPEVPKSGMYAMSAGQAPAGTAFPTARMGEARGARHHTATTLSQPIGAIGPGATRTGNAVIDADSSSPDDFGFDRSGQGFFDFGNMGSGTKDVGMQPNTSPMYSQGSRTSRRSTGMLGV